MKESPIFTQMKSAGTHSTKPLTDAFGKVVESQTGLISLLGRDCGPGSGLVYGAVLCAVLSADDSQGQCAHRKHHRRCCVAGCDAVLHGVRRSLGSHRPQEADDGRLLSRSVSYIPIYKAMQQAAGNNVVTVSSVKDKVTGAIKLTPLTPGRDTGKLVPAQGGERIPTSPCSCFLSGSQVIFACMIYGPIAAYLVEAFPAKVRYTSVSLPYHIGNGVFGGLAAAHRPYALRVYRQYLCRALLSHRCRALIVRVGNDFPERDARHADLGGSRNRWREAATPCESPSKPFAESDCVAATGPCAGSRS